MSSLGTPRGLLEIAKFALYVTIPATLTYAVATDSAALHKLMGLIWPALQTLIVVQGPIRVVPTSRPLFLKRPYVVYPPEGPRPPSPEELKEMAREMAKRGKST